MENIFPIKGRYISIIWLTPFLYLPGLDYVYGLIDQNSEWYWFDIAYYYYYHIIFVALLVFLLFLHKVHWRLMFQKPDLGHYIPSFKLTAFIFVFSIASSYALFYPLSYLWPNFVNYWFIDIPPFIYSNNQQFPILPNILSFISLAVLAPIIEELAFRGILLHRWSQKWGKYTAILISSLLFGIAHPDSIGAFAFGVAMCIVYFRTQTLVMPIVCHSINNIVVWLIEMGYIAWLGANYSYTIEDFRDEWIAGVASTLVVLVWAYVYIKNPKCTQIRHLPKI